MNNFNDIINQIISELVELGLAEKKRFKDKESKESYYILLTPDALNKDFINIIALGYPEKAGVWSYSLLERNQIDASSMKPYFTAHKKENWGLIVLNPHFNEPDYTGDRYFEQTQAILEFINSNSKLGFIGFSMGGSFVVHYLLKNLELINRILGIVLIDPALISNIDKEFLDSIMKKGLLIAASDDMSLGNLASDMYDIPSIQITGIHGEIPNKALDKVIEFFKSSNKS